MTWYFTPEWYTSVAFSGTETVKDVDVSFSENYGYTGPSSVTLYWGLVENGTYYIYGSLGTYSSTQEIDMQPSGLPMYARVRLYFELHPPSTVNQLRTITFTHVHVGMVETATYWFGVGYASGSDTIVAVLKVEVYNPEPSSYPYYVHFYSDGAEIQGSPSVLYYSTRDSAPTYYPNSASILYAKNANSLGVDKPGYKSIGWDTSSPPQTVVYGGEGSGSLSLPENIIPYLSGGLNLYSVWKKKDALFVYVNNQPVSVSEVGVVTQVNETTHTAIVKIVNSGAVRVGSSWKQFSL